MTSQGVKPRKASSSTVSRHGRSPRYSSTRLHAGEHPRLGALHVDLDQHPSPGRVDDGRHLVETRQLYLDRADHGGARRGALEQRRLRQQRRHVALGRDGEPCRARALGEGQARRHGPVRIARGPAGQGRMRLGQRLEGQDRPTPADRAQAQGVLADIGADIDHRVDLVVRQGRGELRQWLADLALGHEPEAERRRRRRELALSHPGPARTPPARGSPQPAGSGRR
jgi:hypothetical protein